MYVQYKFSGRGWPRLLISVFSREDPLKREWQELLPISRVELTLELHPVCSECVCVLCVCVYVCVCNVCVCVCVRVCVLERACLSLYLFAGVNIRYT